MSDAAQSSAQTHVFRGPKNRPQRPADLRKLSVIMPVYNEEKTATDVARAVLQLELPVQLELIVVDDGSTDGTVGTLHEIHDPRLRLITCESNSGKGRAIRYGIEAVSGDIVVIQDADQEYDPDQLIDLLQPILDGDTQVVYGSRFMGSVAGMRKQNLLANKVLSTLTNLLFGAHLTDMETCYKMMDADLLKSLDLKAEKFDIEPEITARLLRRKVGIVEVPIRYKGRTHSDGKKIGYADGFKAISTLLRWRLKRL